MPELPCKTLRGTPNGVPRFFCHILYLHLHPSRAMI